MNYVVDGRLRHGTVFSVYLPTIQPAGQPERVPRQTTRSRQGTGTVLVVEDEQALRELIDTILTDAGYQVLSTGNGRDALKVAGQHDRQVDILLTDVIMPDMNGPQLVEALKVSGREVTALYMSGYDGNLIGQKTDEDLQYLPKPFTQDALLFKINELLSPVSGFSSAL